MSRIFWRSSRDRAKIAFSLTHGSAPCVLPQRTYVTASLKHFTALAFWQIFILLRTGFLGGGMVSIVPPLAAIFLGRRLGEMMRLDGELLGQLALAEDANPVGGAIGQASFLERILIDEVSVIESVV